MAEGVTTIEVKSGYGLDLATERRMLEVARALERATCRSRSRPHILGLHALPAEYRERRRRVRRRRVAAPGSSRSPRRDWWMRSMRSARTSPSPLEETETFLAAAEQLGLRAHVHAGPAERHGGRGARGAPWRAVRRPSRVPERARRAGARASRHGGRAACPAPISPCGRRRRRRCRCCAPRACRWPCPPTANPGTSPCMSILLALNMACTLFGLTPEEARCRRDARGGARARARRLRSALSRWASAPTSPCGGSSGRRSCATTWAPTPARGWSIGASHAPPDDLIDAAMRSCTSHRMARFSVCPRLDTWLDRFLKSPLFAALPYEARTALRFFYRAGSISSRPQRYLWRRRPN